MYDAFMYYMYDDTYMYICPWLLAGMCELIMVNEDLDKEIKSDSTFSKRSLKLAQR